MKDTTKQLQGHRSMTLVELAKQYVHRMSSEPRRRRQREEGFTLIELVIVLVILGILAGIAAPQFFDIQQRAEIQGAASTISSASSSNATACAIGHDDCIDSGDDLGNFIGQLVTEFGGYDQTSDFFGGEGVRAFLELFNCGDTDTPGEGESITCEHDDDDIDARFTVSITGDLD